MADILIVDDEAITLMYLHEQLTIMGHNVVGKASSGPKAVEIARSVSPELVFMDINMPGEYDGVVAAKIIEAELGIPIIFLTAYSNNEYIVEIQKFGPFGYIVKPFKEAEVRVAIHIALYRSKMESKLRRSIEKYKEQLLNEKMIQSILSELNSVYDPYDNLPIYMNLIAGYIRLWKLKIFSYNDEENSFINLSRDDFTKIKSVNLNSYSIEDVNRLKKINMITNFKYLPGFVRDFFKDNSVKSMLSFPIYVEDNFYGVMICLNNENKYFGANTINFLKIIANAVSLLFKRHFDYVKIKEAEEEKVSNEQFRLRSERLVSLGQLATSIAHEINQPLQSIKVLSDSVIFWDKEDKRLPYEKLIENFKKISDRVERVDKIIKNMKMMTKSPDKVQLEEVDVNELIEDILSFYKEKKPASNITLISHLDKNISKILYSEVQLQQIIVNLIENAINASNLSKKETKFIKIETVEKQNHIILIISDNALGIPEENLEKIFDPFFSTYQKKDGMGMGLFVVSNILKSFNSLIEVYNNEDGGASFKITISKNPRNQNFIYIDDKKSM
ncbi:MAG TPA: response regulator [Spirochaetota bacterium]|nr:response regulator [Spirochaetota bacterium]